MSYFLNRTFNLADLENTTNARLNLNIGDISTQRHYDVNILGGNMTVEHFSINNPTDTVQVKDMYLICSNDIGDVHFDDIDRHIPNWANKYQNNVPISAFSNDLMLAFDLHKSAQNNSIFSITTDCTTYMISLTQMIFSKLILYFFQIMSKNQTPYLI